MKIIDHILKCAAEARSVEDGANKRRLEDKMEDLGDMEVEPYAKA